MHRKRKWLHVAVVLMLSLSVALAACSSSKDAGGKDGKTGKIVLYSPETPDMSKELAQAFEKAFSGSKVDDQYGGTSVIVNKLIAEKSSPKADVWYGGGGIFPFESAKSKDIITSYTPEYAKEWKVVQNGIKMRDDDWDWVGVNVFVLGFIYNTDLVKKEDAPKTWDDLLDPKWKGKVQMPNPAASGTATLTVLSQLMKRGDDEGWEYFEKLVEQTNAIPDSGLAPSQAVAKGEAEVAIAFDFMAYEMQGRGESVDFVVPDETPILVNPATLVKDGPNPEGGKQLIDYLLSKEGQELFAKWYMIPIRDDVESKTPLNLEKVLPHAQDLDYDWVVKNYDRIREEWQEKFD